MVAPSESDSSHPRSNSLPPKALHLIVNHLYLCYASQIDSLKQHYCSLSDPCPIASLAFLPFFTLRLVASAWNDAVSKVRHDASFFRRVDAYDPHIWHANTKVRKAVLLRRYRVFRTINSECDRGVYYAYDLGSSKGCLGVNWVIVKAWLDASDRECMTERTIYKMFQSSPMTGTPSILEDSFDTGCGVHAIVLKLLGPTLEDVCSLSSGRFKDKMVLAVAIQMLDRYRDLHARGIIHNGVKPGNICLPPSESGRKPTLYLIDFGLSFVHDTSLKVLLSKTRPADAVGNKTFLSIYGHHGMAHSQRDDLESLAYLLSFLHRGALPWHRVPSRTLQLAQSQFRSRSKFDFILKDVNVAKPDIWRIKMTTPASVLFWGMDSSYVEFWRDVRSLAFGEVPDYDRMKKRFVDCWTKAGYGDSPGEVDWCAVIDQLMKG